MADWEYVLMSKSRKGGRSMMSMRGEDEEFEEEDMWALVRDREAADPSRQKMKIKEASSAWHQHHSASKLIPRANASATIRRLQQSSAPLSIPDWSKIYGENRSRNGSNWLDHDHQLGGGGDDDDGGIVPPHEWVARKIGGTQVSSFSMCEGIGRTLKGRDLSKVRNAVLTKTGFLE